MAWTTWQRGTFDIAYSWGVIHHADSMENCLAEMVRTTKSGGRVKVMLYNKYSLYTLSLLIQHGWLKGKIFKSLDWALWNHMESIGTKGYSRSDVDRFARAYGCTVERVDFYEQKIRKGARFERLRRVMRALTPTPWLFYMAFELRKL